VITITAAVDEAGLLRRCEIRGHAGAGKRGADIVCAAVSALAGAAGRTFFGREGLRASCEAPARGEFILETEVFSGAGRDFLAAAGAFFMEGLALVAGEYPHHCVMTVTKERRN
jgi:uncharacterized protein YsxB (DUF464 family)